MLARGAGPHGAQERVLCAGLLLGLVSASGVVRLDATNPNMQRLDLRVVRSNDRPPMLRRIQHRIRVDRAEAQGRIRNNHVYLAP